MRLSLFGCMIVLVIAPIFEAKAQPPLARETRFDSVDLFVQAIKAFTPDHSTDFLAYQFAVPELGQPEDPATGKIIRAARIESCTVLWQSDQWAVAFAVAAPHTEATRSVTGVLFLLERAEKQWCIASLRKFTASGLYAGVSAELGSSDALPSQDPFSLVINVKESQGGRGLSSELCASYQISGVAFVQSELE